METRNLRRFSVLPKQLTELSFEIMAIFAVFCFGMSGMVQMLPEGNIFTAALDIAGSADAQGSEKGSDFASRIATRLGDRLKARGMPVASLKHLEAAVRQRQQLLSTRLTVVFERAHGGIAETWNATPQAYPLWIVPAFDVKSATFSLSEDAIRQTIHDEFGARLVPPEDVVLEAVEEREGGVLRARTSGVAKSGEVLDEEAAAANVYSGLTGNGSGSITVPIVFTQGIVQNRSDRDLGSLTLLATGQSNYKGSGWGRIMNVEKALRDHVNNTVVVPGQTYSFNQMLEGPVTTGNGWYMAKVIENGVDLVDAPGGGICQASTTMYRAMLNAGFVPEKRKAHSLYVTYYEQYGVGIDATIFPGKQDLTFVNDTQHYLLVQAYNDGFDAYVNIYGTDDGREVELSGPYFSSTADMSPVPLKNVKHNEIVWVHTVRYADGRETQSEVRSLYRAIPRSLAQKYSTAHASAGEPQ